MLNSDVFFMFYLLAREYTARESGYIRGKLIEVDWRGDILRERIGRTAGN